MTTPADQPLADLLRESAQRSAHLPITSKLYNNLADGAEGQAGLSISRAIASMVVAVASLEEAYIEQRKALSLILESDSVSGPRLSSQAVFAAIKELERTGRA